jgi:beta-glucosidase
VTPSSTAKLTHPLWSLRGYGKARDLAPGDSVDVQVNLDKYALSYWCTMENRWKIEKGEYGVLVGASSEDIKISANVEVAKDIFWEGI